MYTSVISVPKELGEFRRIGVSMYYIMEIRMPSSLSPIITNVFFIHRRGPLLVYIKHIIFLAMMHPRRMLRTVLTENIRITNTFTRPYQRTEQLDDQLLNMHAQSSSLQNKGKGFMSAESKFDAANIQTYRTVTISLLPRPNTRDCNRNHRYNLQGLRPELRRQFLWWGGVEVYYPPLTYKV